MKKPTGPKGIGPRYRRKLGTQVSYDREQTERYKSRAARIERAIAIVDEWDQRVTEVPTGNGRTLFLFASDRTANGYWSVVLDEFESDDDIPVTPSPGPEDAPPVEDAGEVTNLGTVFAAHLAPNGWNPGLPGGFKARGLPEGYSDPRTGIIGYPWLTGESWQGGPAIVSTTYAPNLTGVETLDNWAGGTLNQLELDDQPYWLRHGKIYFLAGGGSLLVVLYRYKGPLPVPATYTLGATQWLYEVVNSYSAPLVVDGFADNFAEALPVGITPGVPGSPGPIPGDPTPPPETIPPTDPPRADYSCNCPDYIRVELMDPGSEWPSRWRDREWRDSAAGADGDCKHILAVKLKRGELG